MNTGFTLPDECPRGRENCQPYSHIISENVESFFCVGRHDGSISPVLRDKYSVCFRGERDDTISLYDKRDLVHHAAVMVQSLAIIEELGE